MNIYSLNSLIEFSPDHPTKHIFFEKEKMKAQVVTLDSGQRIPPCRMERDVVFFIMEGKGRIIVDGEEKELEKFFWIFVPKEKNSRSIQAETRMAVLAFLFTTLILLLMPSTIAVEMG